MENNRGTDSAGWDGLKQFVANLEIKECVVCFNNCKLINFPAREDKQCTHSFCENCIEQVDKCPMCRELKRVTKLTREELYYHAISTPIHKMKFNSDEWNRK